MRAFSHPSANIRINIQYCGLARRSFIQGDVGRANEHPQMPVLLLLQHTLIVSSADPLGFLCTSRSRPREVGSLTLAYKCLGYAATIPRHP